MRRSPDDQIVRSPDDQITRSNCSLLITRLKCKKCVDNGGHTSQYLKSVMLLKATISRDRSVEVPI